MLLNKEILIRVIVGFIFFIIFAKVVGPSLFEIFKGKFSGNNNADNDIDSMIKRQKERLKSQYGITGTSTDAHSIEARVPPPTKEIEALYKQSRWGGGEFAKSIQADIAKNYAYTLAETKVNSFVMLAEKRNYLRFLSDDNQKSEESIKNYLGLVLLNLIMTDEIRSKDFNLLPKVAKKCRIPEQEFMLALQLKILYAIKTKMEIKEERLFMDSPSLHQYSEETIKDAQTYILKKEANLWAKGPSLFLEELALHLSYAHIMSPLPKLENKKDLSGAYAVLNIGEDSETEDIKKIYKKLAMAGHPDKIGQMKLPKTLEKKAMVNFNQIQEAYDLIMSHRKK